MAVVGFVPLPAALRLLDCARALRGIGYFVCRGPRIDAADQIQFLGIVGLIVGIALLWFAFGIFTIVPKAYNGAIGSNLAFIGYEIYSATIITLEPTYIILMLLSAGTLYLLLTNTEIKAIFQRRFTPQDTVHPVQKSKDE